MWFIFEYVLGRPEFSTWHCVLEGKGLDAFGCLLLGGAKRAFENYNSCLLRPSSLPSLLVSTLEKIPELLSCYLYIHVSLKKCKYFKT